MLPGAMNMLLLAPVQGFVDPGPRPRFPVVTGPTLPAAPETTGSFTYGRNSRYNPSGPQYSRKIYVKLSPKISDIVLIGVTSDGRVIKEYRSGSKDDITRGEDLNRIRNYQHGVFDNSFGSISWSPDSDDFYTSEDGFEGYSVKYWDEVDTEPPDGPYEELARLDFLNNLSKWIHKPKHFKFIDNYGYVIYSNRVYKYEFSIPQFPTGVPTEKFIGDVPLRKHLEYQTRLVGVAKGSGNFFSSIRSAGHEPTVLHTHDKNGILLESSPTATKGFIECGDFCSIRNEIAIVGSDKVLSYYKIDDLMTTMGSIQLPYLPDDITWIPNGPILLFKGTRIDRLDAVS